MIEANPDAGAEAAALDAERKAGKVAGALHGIPILVKDNVAVTGRMSTTAGSLALDGSVAPADAFIIATAAGGGRRHPRQDEPQRVGQLPIDAVHERLVADAAACRATRTCSTATHRDPARGPAPPLPANLCAARVGTRDGRLDRLARRIMPRLVGAEADGRPAEPARHHPDLAHARTPPDR